MSGGHFDYIQYRIDDAALEIAEKAKDYSKTCSPQTIARFEQASETLEIAAKMLHRIDWFISCDDGEDTFNRLWEEDGIDSRTQIGK